MLKEKKFLKYVGSLGFHDPVLVPTKHYPLIVGFRYSSFTPEAVRANLGKEKKHTPDGRFVFVIDKAKALRVCTASRTILLCNGERAVKAILNSLKANK
jgi:hypothetical protein